MNGNMNLTSIPFIDAGIVQMTDHWYMLHIVK